METKQAKLNKTMENKNKSTTPESGSSNSTENKYYTSSTSSPSSNFTFEADLLPICLPEQIIASKIQQLLPKYNASVLCLLEAFDEVNLLQEENLKLTALNIDLEILVTSKQNEILSSVIGGAIPDFNSKPPREVPDHISVETNKKDDVSPRGLDFVPRAISVRSTGSAAALNYMNNTTQLTQPSILGVPNSCKELGSTGSKTSRVIGIAKSKVGEEEAVEVELAVYKQGMTKTELCNKWEETGDCPYGDRCQFAHGVEELRPVLRHPKYKTTLCRLITSGGTCQYGHRCHFRHPNQDKELVL